MQAAAHNSEFADKAGIKQSVAQDFTAADKAKDEKSKARSGKRYGAK